MAHISRYIAVDLGAESGRIMLGELSEQHLQLEEIYRFSNEPLEENGSLKWDFGFLLSEIQKGLARAVRRAEGLVSGIAVDSWGVDFGLLDKDKRLMENPYHYRDSRTEGVMEKAFEIMPRREIFQNSGLQFMKLNTLYQLLAVKQKHPEVLRGAGHLVFMADLVSYFLCGRIFAEYTLAGTSQLMDMRSGQWSEAIFKKFGLPLDIMPEIIPPGTIVGPLQSAICRELATEPIKVVAAGSHDTACAVAAVPAETENWAYISSGTWSLIGVEIDRPIINDEVLNHGFTNEGGAANTIRFLKNSMGLWPLQQCKRQWQSEGADLSYNELTALAQNAEPFAVHLDLNFEPLFTPGDMPAKINEYLKKTGQSPLRDKGQMVRTILESLALQYRSVIEAIERIRKIPVEVIHIVGGGSQNDLLSQFAADAVGKKVIAGPVEATAMGNITLQAIADGQIKSLPQGREIIRHSVELKTYHPQEREKWSVPYFKYMV